MKWVMQLLAVALVLCAGVGQAQDFPRQPIRIIVPFPPGASADILSRLVAEELTTSLGQPVTVENRSGATGLVGIGSLAQAAADGYTIGLGNEATHVTVPLLKKKVAYDPIKDFTPLSLAVRTTMAIAVNPAMLPVKNLQELVEVARSRPGGVSYGTPGDGSPQQLIGELLKQHSGGNFVHVPYPGATAATQDLFDGKVPMIVSTLPTLMAHLDKVRIIAVADATRLRELPGVPTVSETWPDFVVAGWSGYFGPANMQPAIAAKLSAAITAALRKRSVIDAARKYGLEAVANTAEELRMVVKTGLERWAPVMQRANLLKQQ
jgi:tripartite-type tricarboxylate transporter receptor subunit TctC